MYDGQIRLFSCNAIIVSWLIWYGRIIIVSKGYKNNALVTDNLDGCLDCRPNEKQKAGNELRPCSVFADEGIGK